MANHMHGGLSGKARKMHRKLQAERIHAQQLIEEFLERDGYERAPERVIPVKHQLTSSDSRYAYEFVAAAQEELAQSEGAKQFEQTVRDAQLLDAASTAASKLSPSPAQASGAGAVDELRTIVGKARESIATDEASLFASGSGDASQRTAASVIGSSAEGRTAKGEWSSRVQPKLFTYRRQRKLVLPEVTWSGLLTGLLIGAAAGVALLGLLSLIV